MSSSGGVQRPNFADHRYQEAVGNLKQLLADGGSYSGRGSDAGSVRSRARSVSRALDPSIMRPELSHHRAEVGSYRRHYSASRAYTSSYRGDTTSYRSGLTSYKPDLTSFRPEVTSYRPDVTNIRPQSAMEVSSERRFDPLPMGPGSVRALSPVSVRSLRLTADDPLQLTDDVIGPDAVDSTGGGHTKLADNGNVGSREIQVLELRQLSLRQEALCQQLEEENAELRDAADEMRGYVQQLVAENATLAEDLRTRAAETVNAESLATAETRLKDVQEELERFKRQAATQEKNLKSAHAEQLRNAGLEKDRLAGSVEQLKTELEELRRQAEKAEQKAVAAQQKEEQARSAQSEADSTVARLRRELEEKDRQADRTQMEHERRLVAASEHAEKAVRDTFDKLQQQLNRQQQRIAELEDERAPRAPRKEQELQLAVDQQRKAAIQAKPDTDSAATRHQRELEALQKRIQVPAVQTNPSHERLRREMAILRQQLTATENQLTIANRERGRLQQQTWRLERRPDAGLDRDSLGGVLGDDGMTLLPRQLERVLSGTDRGSGSHRYQLPTSYRQMKTRT